MRDTQTFPSNSTPDDLIDRARMSIEELAEWIEAHVESNLASAADAWGDRCFGGL